MRISQLSIGALKKEMQARPDLQKSLEEFRKKPYALRNKESFNEVLEREKEKLK